MEFLFIVMVYTSGIRGYRKLKTATRDYWLRHVFPFVLSSLSARPQTTFRIFLDGFSEIFLMGTC